MRTGFATVYRPQTAEEQALVPTGELVIPVGSTAVGVKLASGTVSSLSSAAGGGSSLRAWASGITVEAGEILRASATSGTIGIGDFMSSNSTRTTGSTFDSTEATFFTELPNDPDMFVSTTVSGSSDLNTLVTSGIFLSDGLGTPANAPTGFTFGRWSAIVTEVTASGTATIHQLLWSQPASSGNHQIWHRNRINATTWDTWMKNATTDYVDSAVNTRGFKLFVRAATTVAVPAHTMSGMVMTASVNEVLTAIDGVALVANDRILVKNETIASHNGIYVITDVGSASTPWIMTRAIDADGAGELNPMAIIGVSEGMVNAKTYWNITNTGTVTIGTTSLTFEQAAVSKALLDSSVLAGSVSKKSTIHVGAIDLAITDAHNNTEIHLEDTGNLTIAASAITTDTFGCRIINTGIEVDTLTPSGFDGMFLRNGVDTDTFTTLTVNPDYAYELSVTNNAGFKYLNVIPVTPNIKTIKGVSLLGSGDVPFAVPTISSQDFNLLSDAGIYSSKIPFSSPTNGPTGFSYGRWSCLVTVTTDENPTTPIVTVAQILWAQRAANVPVEYWIRNRYDATNWTTWERVVTTSATMIKNKKLTGTCAAVSGTVNIAHGLTQANIRGMTAIVLSAGGTAYTPLSDGTSSASYYGMSADATNVVVATGSNASNIASRPITIIVQYED